MKYFRQFTFFLIVSFGLAACSSDDLSNINDILYVRNNGADIPAYIYGNGASNTFVIILHGGPGGTGLEYRIGDYSDALEDRYGVVYFDQRGQGMAQGHYDKSDVTVEQMAEDVYVLAQILRHKYNSDIKIFLLGHSWGGTLGTAVMIDETYQQAFNGWIEVAGAHDFPLLYRGAIRQFQTVGQEQIQRGNNLSFWESSLDRVNELDTNEVDLSYINKRGFEAEAKLQEDNFINDADGVDLALVLSNKFFVNNIVTTTVAGAQTAQDLVDNGLESYSATPELHKIKLPTLLLWGRYDMIVSPELGQSALEHIGASDKHFVLFPNSGHSPMVTETQAFIREVTDFIDRH